MAWKRLASAGSCLTMSPPLKTASMYIHRLCTPSQPSTHSATVPRRLSQVCTSSLKGAAYLRAAGHGQPGHRPCLLPGAALWTRAGGGLGTAMGMSASCLHRRGTRKPLAQSRPVAGQMRRRPSARLPRACSWRRHLLEDRPPRTSWPSSSAVTMSAVSLGCTHTHALVSAAALGSTCTWLRRSQPAARSPQPAAMQRAAPLLTAALPSMGGHLEGHRPVRLEVCKGKLCGGPLGDDCAQLVLDLHSTAGSAGRFA